MSWNTHSDICRRTFKQIIEILQYQSDSSDEESSSDEDLDLLFLEFAFQPQRERGPHLSLDNIDAVECEEMFR